MMEQNSMPQHSNHPMLPRRRPPRVNPHAAADRLPLNEAAKIVCIMNIFRRNNTLFYL